MRTQLGAHGPQPAGRPASPPLRSGTVGYKRRTFVGSPLWMVRRRVQACGARRTGRCRCATRPAATPGPHSALPAAPFFPNRLQNTPEPSPLDTTRCAAPNPASCPLRPPCCSRYQAPEVIEQSPDNIGFRRDAAGAPADGYDEAADIWSLGITAMEVRHTAGLCCGWSFFFVPHRML